MKHENRPLNKAEVRAIKPGTKNAFVHPGPNRQWRRSLRRSFKKSNAHSDFDKQSNRKETKGREQIKQRIKQRIEQKSESGNPLVTLGGQVKIAFSKAMKVIFHKRSNPFL